MLWTCTDCTTRYAVGLLCCPHCGSLDHTEDGSMPKTHADGTVTDAARDAELADLDQLRTELPAPTLTDVLTADVDQADEQPGEPAPAARRRTRIRKH